MDNNSLVITFRDKERISSNITPMMIFAISVCCLGFSAMCGSFLKRSDVGFFPVIGICIAALVFMLTCDRFLMQKNLSGAEIVFVTAVCAVFHEQLIKGTGSVMNDILDRMTLLTGKIYLDFAFADDSCALWTVGAMAVIFVSILFRSLRDGKMFFVLFSAVTVYILCASGFLEINTPTALFFFGAVLSYINFLGFDGEAAEAYSGKWYYIPIFLICILMIAGVGYFSDEKDTAGIVYIKDYVHQLLYDSKTNAMPEGKLKNLGARAAGNTPAIEITMQENSKMYLRGAVYEVYDGSGWKSQDKSLLSEYEDLFYNLHKSGFYGQTQISGAQGVLQDEEPLQMNIRNLSACSAHGYYPYAVIADAPAKDYIGDTIYPSAENISYTAGSLPQWYMLQQSLALRQDEAEVREYLAMEEAYEKYVREADLQLTDTVWSILDDEIGETGSVGLSDIRDEIRNYLSENLVYDENVVTENGNSDFVDYTLNNTERGYDIHFATIATLMLRYYGVPSRYVEGYFISEEDALMYENGQSIVLTENHAHAWAEYYLPGVGFVPFEVTPGYMDDEEDEIGTDNSSGGVMYVSENLRYARIKKPEQTDEMPRKRLSFSMEPEYLLYILAAVLIILSGIIFRRRYLFKKAIARIDSADNRQAICMRYGYVAVLMKSAGLTDDEEGIRARMLNREAIFSQHEMTDGQRLFMDEYAEKILAKCKNTWTFVQKLRYRLWDCLY